VLDVPLCHMFAYVLFSSRFFFRQNHIQSFIDSSPAIHSETGLHGNINGLEVPGRSYNWADKPMSQLWLFVMVKYSQMKSEISHSNLNI